MTGFILTVDMVNDLLRAFISSTLDIEPKAVLVETRARARAADTSPYVTIYWKEQELLNQFEGDYIRPYDEDERSEDGTELLYNDSYCTVRLTCRGKDAYKWASELRYALDSSNRQFDLYNIIGFAGCSSVTDVSTVFGGQLYQQTFVELSFYACFGRMYPLAYFDSVPWIIKDRDYLFPRWRKPCPMLP